MLCAGARAKRDQQVNFRIGTILPLIDRGFVPDFKRIREALGVPADTKDSVFYEQYDTEPVINVKDPAVVEPLKARMQAALAKLS